MCAHTHRDREHSAASGMPAAAIIARRPRAGDDAGLRVSDAEREVTVDELRRHAGSGRLDPEELDERLDAALGARTRGELDAVLHDLPAPAPAPIGAPTWRGQSPWIERFTTYLWVMALLVAIWAFTGAGHPWPLYPALGWGLPLMMARPRQSRSSVT